MSARSPLARLVAELREREPPAPAVEGLPAELRQEFRRLSAQGALAATRRSAVLGPSGAPQTGAWVALGVVVVLALVALVGRGKAPFYAAVAIALVDVVLLVAVAS